VGRTFRGTSGDSRKISWGFHEDLTIEKWDNTGI
jgi:hypothetical protein